MKAVDRLRQIAGWHSGEATCLRLQAGRMSVRLPYDRGVSNRAYALRLKADDHAKSADDLNAIANALAAGQLPNP